MKHEDIELARQAISAAVFSYDKAHHSGMVAPLLDELAALRERGQWRPIEEFDGLSDHAVLVIIDGSPFMGSRDDDGVWTIDGDFGEPLHPTHFQQIPLLPEAPR